MSRILLPLQKVTIFASIIFKEKNMKKVLVVLSLICFVAVSATYAQSPASASKETKKEASVTPAASATADAPAMNCHGSAKKSCCKNGDAKACTPEMRAACAEKAKADAAPGSTVKPETN